jgi:hypothetical protein
MATQDRPDMSNGHNAYQGNYENTEPIVPFVPTSTPLNLVFKQREELAFLIRQAKSELTRAIVSEKSEAEINFRRDELASLEKELIV